MTMSTKIDWTDSQIAVERFLRDPSERNREIAIEGYKRMVFRIANQYAAHAELDDLVQEGFFGLTQALDRYDPSTGNSFSTYAAWYIRGTIQHYLTRQTHAIHVPSWVLEFYNKQATLMSRMIAEGIEVTDEALAERMGYTLERYQSIIANNPHFKFESIDEIVDKSETNSEQGNGAFIPATLQCDFRGKLEEDAEVTERFQEMFFECKGKSALKIAQILQCDTITALEIHGLLNQATI